MSREVIYKYDLYSYTNEIHLPMGAVFLSAGYQGDKLVSWFRVNPNNEVEVRRFTLIATGQEYVPTGLQYLQTVQQSSGLVWHIHERKDTDET